MFPLGGVVFLLVRGWVVGREGWDGDVEEGELSKEGGEAFGFVGPVDLFERNQETMSALRRVREGNARKRTHSRSQSKQEHRQSIHVGEVAFEEKRNGLELPVLGDLELEVLLEHLFSFQESVVDPLQERRKEQKVSSRLPKGTRRGTEGGRGTHLDFRCSLFLLELRLGDELDGCFEEGSDTRRRFESESGVGSELKETELVEELLALESEKGASHANSSVRRMMRSEGERLRT